jgi:hypothetical protein
MWWTPSRSTIGAALVAVANGVIIVGFTAASSEPPAEVDEREARRPQAMASEPGPRSVVLLYGDSLAWEAQEHFESAFDHLPNVEVISKTYGGTAICDWLSVMRTDVATLAPDVVVVEFSGNALTDCMQDGRDGPLMGRAYLDRYRADARSVVEIFRPVDAHLFFVGAPSPRVLADEREFDHEGLDALYRQLAASESDQVDYVDAGAAVLDEGRWTATMPCRADEPCEGGTDASGRLVNFVRAPDGSHFCPTGDRAVAGVTDRCAVWSSGAFRFGRAMARPVVEALA